MNEYMTLGQALQLDDKSKADILCRLDKCEAKTGQKSGKVYFNCKVSWEGAQAWASFFGNSPDSYLNRNIIIRGAEIGSYNGKKQVTAGKFAKVEEYHFDLEPTQRPATHQPTQTVGSRAAPSAPPQSQGKRVSGEAAGMALKAAVDVWIACRGTEEWMHGSTFVEQTARDIIAMSERIQSGAPAEKEVPF